MEILIMMQGICKQLKWLLGIRRRKCLSHGYFTCETKKKKLKQVRKDNCMLSLYDSTVIVVIMKKHSSRTTVRVQ